MINVVQFVTTLFLVVAITSSVKSKNIEWRRNDNSTDETMSTEFPVIPTIDELNEDAVELLPEYSSSDRNNSNSRLMFDMPIAAAVLISVILLICCCFCCTRLIVQWDVFRKTRAYETLKKRRAADIARRLKLIEQQHICEKFNHIKK